MLLCTSLQTLLQQFEVTFIDKNSNLDREKKHCNLLQVLLHQEARASLTPKFPHKLLGRLARMHLVTNLRLGALKNSG